MRATYYRRIIKYALFTGAVTGTFLSWRGNQYNIDNIGIVRLARSGIAVFRVGYHYKFELFNSGFNEDTKEYKELRSKVHLISANLLLDLCRANKGVYVKVGQHIGSLEYLVPTEYVQTMKVLHAHAPSSPVDHIKQVIKEEFGQEPENIFSDFELEPLGAASLAQVHKAKMKKTVSMAKEGQTVAVKVQHPYVRGNSIIDLATMEALVHIVSWVFPEFKFKWLVEESKKNINRELDFREEADNTMKVKTMFSHLPWLKIPDIYPELSSRRVIVMEFVEGGQVNDVNYMSTHGIDPFDVSNKLGRLYSEMIFTKGFVHSDPHPGNILVNKDSSGGRANIVLLDHGLYALVSEKVKMNYSKLWLSILSKDQKGMKKYCKELGVDEMYPLFACMVSGRTWNAIQSGLATTRHDHKEKETFQHDIPLVIPQITEVLASVNRELLLILKTNDLLRGIEHTLKTNDRMSSFLVMSRFCVRCVYGDERKSKSNAVSKYVAIFNEQWALFKLNIYYIYLSFKSFSWSSLVNTLSFELA